MKTVNPLAVIGATAVLISGGIWVTARGRAQAAVDRAPDAHRRNVELTIYNDDFALVRETRSERLAQGSNVIELPEVSRELDPHSVSLTWQGGADAPELTAQSYDVGVTSQDDLLKRFIGRQVEIVRYGENGHEAEREPARLMVEGNGSEVLQTGGKLLINPPGNIEAPANTDVVTIPQLSVQAESATSQTSNLDIAYLSRGLKWSADYVATLPSDPSDSTVNLECWASVENHSGLDYPSARVSLVAGSPNRAVNPDAGRSEEKQSLAFSEELASAASSVDRAGARGNPGVGSPQALGEYHAYPITHPTTVIQERMNRLLMFSSRSVHVLHDYSASLPVISPWDAYGNSQPGPSRNGTVGDSITFFNTVANHLSEPLPHGAMRVYEPDASGTVQYVGAAEVQDTPNNQRVDLTLGNAFDLTTEWRIAKSQRVARHTVRMIVELTIQNAKTGAVDVRVVQQVQSPFTIVHEDGKHIVLNSEEVQWKVPAHPGKTIFNYAIDVKQ